MNSYAFLASFSRATSESYRTLFDLITVTVAYDSSLMV